MGGCRRSVCAAAWVRSSGLAGAAAPWAGLSLPLLLCRAAPSSAQGCGLGAPALPLPGDALGTEGLRNPGVGKSRGAASCPAPCPRLCWAQHRQQDGRSWRQGLQAALISCCLDWMEPMEIFYYSLAVPPASQLGGVRPDDAGGFLIPVLMGCWRCLAQAPWTGTGSLL